jgi:uncharacterized surface protein with fasciclin (FAS1) repeats
MMKSLQRILVVSVAIGALAACSGKEEEKAMPENAMAEANAMDGEMASGDAPMVGGAPMFPDKNVVENASTAGNLKTLVAAVKAAGLVETLSGPGPFTVFAPDDAAFGKLPAGTVDTLVKPENKAKLTGILTYHVVAGTLSAAELDKKIEEGKGKAVLKTVAGGTLTATREGPSIVLMDAAGGKSTVSQADVFQSNGVAHVIDSVLLPSK